MPDIFPTQGLFPQQLPNYGVKLNNLLTELKMRFAPRDAAPPTPDTPDYAPALLADSGTGYDVSQPQSTLITTPQSSLHEELAKMPQGFTANQNPPQTMTFDKPELTSNLVEALRGKEYVSKQFVEDAMKMQGVKEYEKGIAGELLKNSGDQVYAPQFIKDMQQEFLPLRRDAGPSRYKGINLPREKQEPSIYGESVYQSPIKTSAGETHFPSNIVNDDVGDPEVQSYPKYFAHTRHQDLVNPEEGYATGETQVPKPYTGQNIMKPGDTRRILEVQSDLFQKGNLELQGGSSKEIKILQNSLLDAQEKFKTDPSYKDMVNGYKSELKQELKKNKEIKKLEPFENDWYKRVIREELHKASVDGKTKLQFPTGNTAMEIEGLGDANVQWQDATHGVNALMPLAQENLHEGMKIRDNAGNNWRIVGVSKDDLGSFRAVSQREWNQAEKDFGQDGAAEFLNTHEAGESFSISGKLDSSHPIHKFYEGHMQKFLKQLDPSMERVKDSKGNEWFQIKVDPNEKKKPIKNLGMLLKKDAYAAT